MIRRMSRSSPCGLLVGALLSFSFSCGDDESGVGSEDAAILSFSAEPDTLTEGESTLLSWSTQGARAVYLTSEGIRLSTEALPASGAWEVAPSETADYRLEAFDHSGALTTSELIIQVEERGPPRIEAFEASAGMYRMGDPPSRPTRRSIFTRSAASCDSTGRTTGGRAFK